MQKCWWVYTNFWDFFRNWHLLENNSKYFLGAYKELSCMILCIFIHVHAKKYLLIYCFCFGKKLFYFIFWLVYLCIIISLTEFNNQFCSNSCYHVRIDFLLQSSSEKTSQVTYVTMVPRMGNETLRPLGVATGNALSVTRSEDTYEKTPPVGRRQPMTSLPACHNISAAGRIHHQLLRLKLASEAWSNA